MSPKAEETIRPVRQRETQDLDLRIDNLVERAERILAAILQRSMTRGVRVEQWTRTLASTD
jgi:hypothetical protein